MEGATPTIPDIRRRWRVQLPARPPCVNPRQYEALVRVVAGASLVGLAGAWGVTRQRVGQLLRVGHERVGQHADPAGPCPHCTARTVADAARRARTRDAMRRRLDERQAARLSRIKLQHALDGVPDARVDEVLYFVNHLLANQHAGAQSC